MQCNARGNLCGKAKRIHSRLSQKFLCCDILLERYASIVISRRKRYCYFARRPNLHAFCRSIDTRLIGFYLPLLFFLVGRHGFPTNLGGIPWLSILPCSKVAWTNCAHERRWHFWHPVSYKVIYCTLRERASTQSEIRVTRGGAQFFQVFIPFSRWSRISLYYQKQVFCGNRTHIEPFLLFMYQRFLASCSSLQAFVLVQLQHKNFPTDWIGRWGCIFSRS